MVLSWYKTKAAHTLLAIGMLFYLEAGIPLSQHGATALADPPATVQLKAAQV